MTIEPILSVENPVFTSYIFYCSVLVLKMLFLSPWTSIFRYKTGEAPPGKLEDSDVERIRRAHRNDLENILPFMAVAFVYMLTTPNPWLAIHLMKAYTCARIAHTLVYAVVVIPQPTRAIAWGVAFVIQSYMAVASAIYFLSAV